MNYLPEHRRAINGRTYSQPWSAASMDPIESHERGVSGVFRWLGAGLGVLAALMLFVHLFLSQIGA